jgi:polyhydroxyalkanoate synthesis regulator phasin
MLDSMKKTVQASIGAIVLTRERIRKTLDRLVREGKLSTEDAERVLDQMVRDGKEEFKGIQDRMASLMQKGLGKLDLVSRKDFAALEKRVKALEGEKRRRRTTRTPKKKS